MLSQLLEAIGASLLKHVDAIVGALVVAAIAWIKVLTDRAHAREVIADSAVRQALDAHGDEPAADQAAADELHRVPERYRPKDVRRAVSKAMERERARSVRPPADLDAREQRVLDDLDDDRDTIPACGPGPEAKP